MSRSYRELKDTISLLQKLCSEQDSRLQQANRQINYLKNQLAYLKAANRELGDTRQVNAFFVERYWAVLHFTGLPGSVFPADVVTRPLLKKDAHTVDALETALCHAIKDRMQTEQATWSGRIPPHH